MHIFKDLLRCKSEVIKVWAFFFILSLLANSPHSVFVLFLISGGFSIFITSLAIMFVKTGHHL